MYFNYLFKIPFSRLRVCEVEKQQIKKSLDLEAIELITNATHIYC